MRFYSFSLRKKRKYTAYLELCKEIKKIGEVGNKHGNGDEFLDFFVYLFFFWHKKC